jgi:heat shock protein HslJ
MACPDPIGAQENRYLKALGQAERFEQTGDALTVHCKGSDTPLRFVRK